jgi:hypothetical protein
VVRSRWFWLPGAAFALPIAPLVSGWLPAVVFGDGTVGTGFLIATAAVARA